MRALWACVALLGAAPAAALDKPEFSARPPLGAAAKFRPPAPTTLVLPTGLTAVSLARPGFPLVHLAISVQAGSALDPPEKSGLAWLVAESLIDGGAGARDGRSMRDAVDALGGDLVIEAGVDGAYFLISIPEEKLEPALELFHDALVAPRFAPAEVAKVRARLVAREVLEHSEAEITAARSFMEAAFAGHPYANWPHGGPALASLRPADLIAFHQAHYGPRRTAINVVGGQQTARILAAIEARFSGWKTELKGQEPGPPLPKPTARLILVDRPGSAQSALVIGHLGPNVAAPETPAAQVLAEILGGSFTSRINQNLRETHGYTYGAFAQHHAARLSGTFAVATLVHTEVTGAAIRETLGELEKMSKIPEEERLKAVAQMRMRMVGELSEGEPLALRLATEELAGAPADGVMTAIDAWERVDLAQLMSTEASVVQRDPWIIVVVGDRKRVEPQLSGLPK
ncbi:MAG: pitrilysin family protein [Myxococcota bacterium]